VGKIVWAIIMKKFGEYILSSGFHLKYFVQKLKGYKSLRLYKTIHGADDSKTLCGIELNEYYYISGFIGIDNHLKVTCRYCLREARKDE
jgi:hypothetical protein